MGFPGECKNSMDTQGSAVLASAREASPHTASWHSPMCAVSAGLSLALCSHSLLDPANDHHKNSAANAGASDITNDTTNIEAPRLGTSSRRPPEHTKRTQQLTAETASHEPRN